MAKIYSLPRGASVFDELLRTAKEEKLTTARVEAIGGVNELTLAYFNREERRYEEHAYKEFLEVAGMLGNITLKEGRPFLHLHGTFGRRDMSAVAGHVISARVFPVMEVVVTPTQNTALRGLDEETGLNVICKIEPGQGTRTQA